MSRCARWRTATNASSCAETTRCVCAKTVDARYRDWQQVERNFRTVKTTFLEIRPAFLRKSGRTKVHVFVAMPVSKITRRFEAGLRQAFGTTGNSATTITPDEHQTRILGAMGLSFPKPKTRKVAV